MKNEKLSPPDWYSPYSRGSAKNTYIHALPDNSGCIYLDITHNGMAVLSAVMRNITLSTGEFSYPHRLFDVFESELISAYLGAKSRIG